MFIIVKKSWMVGDHGKQKITKTKSQKPKTKNKTNQRNNSTLASNLLMISPTRLRCTPSGLIMMYERSDAMAGNGLLDEKGVMGRGLIVYQGVAALLPLVW